MAAVDPQLWRGRRVLITGHSGFKGAWLSLWLQMLGARVTGFGLPAPPTEPSLFALAGVAAGMADVVEGDVRSFEDVEAAVRAARPEVVFHLAAQPMVRRSLAEPRLTYEVNVLGTVNLLEAVRLSGGAPLVVVATSDKCYENESGGAENESGGADAGADAARARGAGGPAGARRAFAEGDPLGGVDPYSSSKACAELVCRAYGRSFFAGDDGPRLATARAGNVIGGGDWGEDRIVPDLLRSLQDGASPLRVRHPHAVRPWQHVLNPLAGYLQLAQALERSPEVARGAWNFGPSAVDALTVEDLLDRIARRWPDSGLRWVADGDGQPSEAAHLALDSTRAREALGWRARWDLDAGLRELVAWHRSHRAGEDMHAVSVAQIERYMAAA